MKRIIFAIAIISLVLIVAPIALVAASLQPTPMVSQRLASTAEGAARAREILRELRLLSESDTKTILRLSETDINNTLAFSMRALPGVRGEARVRSQAIWLKFSADARRIPGGGWLNLQAIVRPSETGLEIGAIRMGPFNLPSGFVLPVLGTALDIALGDGLGTMAIGGITSVAIEERTAIVGIGLDSAQRQTLVRRAKQTVRSAVGISSPEKVRVYYAALHAAAKSGKLSRSGSTTPYLRFAIAEAHRRASDGNDQEEIKASLLALAIYCGHPKFQIVIGDVVPEGTSPKDQICSNTALNGRGDLRQHFTISAGLQAVGDNNVAFAIGEFKELIDTNTGGSGFSFDDLAADRAGIRFAKLFLESDADARESLLKLMDNEPALFPRIDDLPSGLTKSEFKRRFGNVEGEAYKNMVARIDNRISRLLLFSRQ